MSADVSARSGTAPVRGRLCVVGTGPGPGYLTPRGLELMRSCDHFVGGRAVLRNAPTWGTKLAVAGSLDDLLDDIDELLRRPSDVCVLTSGDPGYFSLGAALERRFPGEPVVEPGVSSVQVLAARVGVPWQHLRHHSAHGRELDFDPPRDEPCAVLCDPQNGPARVARYLLDAGVDGTAVVGSSLGRPDEEVRVLDLEAAASYEPDGPAVLLAYPRGWDGPRPVAARTGAGSAAGAADAADESFPGTGPAAASSSPILTATGFGPADEEFARAEGVPLSRKETRLLLAGVASPEVRRTMWDIGAGSGGFTVQLALRSPLAAVVAFEPNEDAIPLLEENLQRFGVRAEVVSGAAPEALFERPAEEQPDLVVVGGSGGRLEEILTAVAERMAPGGRVVCTAVTLETVSIATRVLGSEPWSGFDALQITVANRSSHGILKGTNPITLMWADREED